MKYGRTEWKKNEDMIMDDFWNTQRKRNSERRIQDGTLQVKGTHQDLRRGEKESNKKKSKKMKFTKIKQCVKEAQNLQEI